MKVLAVGAHPDDIELGCGATLAAHAAAGHAVVMLVMTEGQRGPGGLKMGPVRRAEQKAAAGILGAKVHWGGLMDCDVREDRDTVEIIEAVVADLVPDVVYTHWPNDSHQDHRAVSAAAVAAARKVGRVLYFASPSSMEFHPTIYVSVDEYIETKLKALEAHASQVDASLMVDPEGMRATARFYGLAARCHYAEAFAPLRMTWSPAHMSPSVNNPAASYAGPYRRRTDPGYLDVGLDAGVEQ